ncbi:Annexin [Phytophthora infestans]|uniref:Annexin n=1 Tax=Phytophthora infestans TaxID=4787 RepID=A0A833WF96_PHYIN|nr:Annexin [Phytophthora infestans]
MSDPLENPDGHRYFSARHQIISVECLSRRASRSRSCSCFNPPPPAQPNFIHSSLCFQTQDGASLSEVLVRRLQKGVNQLLAPPIDAIVEKIYAVCGTDDKAFVQLIGPLSPSDRALVSLRYKALHGHTLPEDAELIFKAVEGRWGTDENRLVNVLLASPPEHLSNIIAAYQAKYRHDLVRAIQKDFSGNKRDARIFYSKV